MGDRRNIVVDFGNGTSVALYSHWGGSDLQAVLAKALARGRSRWNDPSYLTRIIFSEMIAAESGDDVIATLMDTTGFGISPFLTDIPEYDEASPSYDLTVSIKDQTVYDGDGDTHTMEGYVQEFLT